MAVYIAFVALLNLGLGYALAVYTRESSGRTFREFIADLLSKLPARPVAAPPSYTAPPIVAEADPTPVEAKQATVRPNVLIKPEKDEMGLVSREDVDWLLAELTAISDPVENPSSVVLVELDATEVTGAVDEDRLLNGLAKSVRELLAETHTAARFSDHQLLLLLPGDNESVATKRAERVRQRIEATEFMADNQPIQATVTCALAQLSTDYAVADLLASLKETVDEAKRLGGNRTYMYDGMTPSPVVPPELNLSPQKCAI